MARSTQSGDSRTGTNKPVQKGIAAPNGAQESNLTTPKWSIQRINVQQEDIRDAMEPQIEEGTLRDARESQVKQIQPNEDAHQQYPNNPHILILDTGGEKISPIPVPEKGNRRHKSRRGSPK